MVGTLRPIKLIDRKIQRLKGIVNKYETLKLSKLIMNNNF